MEQLKETLKELRLTAEAVRDGLERFQATPGMDLEQVYDLIPDACHLVTLSADVVTKVAALVPEVEAPVYNKKQLKLDLA